MKRALLLASTLALAACGGAGVGSAIPPPTTRHALATLHLHLGIPASASASASRRPQRVSPAVMGVGVVVYFHSDPTHMTAVGSAAYDVSATSSLCASGANGSRSCTIDVPAPVPGAGDSDDVIITTYDSVPSGGVIPPSAKSLDQGTINVTPVAGGSLSPSVVFGGIPATLSITVQNPNAFYDANLYGAMSYYVEVVAQDASGATIVGSDPYASPIVLTSNGAFSGAGSMQVTSPNQPVFVTAPSTGTSLTMSAANPAASINVNMHATGFTQTIATVAGATQLQAGIDNLVYVPTATSANAYDPHGQTLAGSIAAGAAQHFYGISAMPPGSGNGAVLIGYANATGNGFAFVDLSTVQIEAGDPIALGTNIQPVPAGSVQYYTHDNYMCDSVSACSANMGGTQAVLGSDGNLWVAAGSQVRRVSLDLATTTNFSTGLTAGANVASIVAAPDGNLYALDYANGQVVKIMTSGTITTYSAAGATGNIIVGPDDALWFPESSAIARFDLTTHAVTTIALSFTPVWMTLASDGAFWTLDGSGNVIRVIP